MWFDTHLVQHDTVMTPPSHAFTTHPPTDPWMVALGFLMDWHFDKANNNHCAEPRRDCQENALLLTFEHTLHSLVNDLVSPDDIQSKSADEMDATKYEFILCISWKYSRTSNIRIPNIRGNLAIWTYFAKNVIFS